MELDLPHMGPTLHALADSMTKICKHDDDNNDDNDDTVFDSERNMRKLTPTKRIRIPHEMIMMITIKMLVLICHDG